jgi:hypothetical protein
VNAILLESLLIGVMLLLLAGVVKVEDLRTVVIALIAYIVGGTAPMAVSNLVGKTPDNPTGREHP